jgi:hypothetical protein
MLDKLISKLPIFDETETGKLSLEDIAKEMNLDYEAELDQEELVDLILEDINEIDIDNGLPYNTIAVEGNVYDDYAMCINGRSFEVSICRETRKLTINKFGE